VIVPAPDASSVTVPVPGRVNDRFVESVPEPVNLRVVPLASVTAGVVLPRPMELLFAAAPPLLASFVTVRVPADTVTAPPKVLPVAARASSFEPVFVIPKVDPEIVEVDPVDNDPPDTLIVVVAVKMKLLADNVFAPAVLRSAPAEEIPEPPIEMLEDVTVIPEALSKVRAAPEEIVVPTPVADPNENADLIVN
jgi:hypothetical protein